MAILDLVDKISQKIDSKYYSMGIFIDLSEAFDTINHKRLIDKLEYYGIRGIVPYNGAILPVGNVGIVPYNVGIVP